MRAHACILVLRYAHTPMCFVSACLSSVIGVWNSSQTSTALPIYLRDLRAPLSSTLLLSAFQAAALRSAGLFVRRQEQQPKLAPDEIMLWQLEGLSLLRATSDADGAWLSTLSDLVGTVVGVIPCEEITGDPNLGHDLLEVALIHNSDEQGSFDEEEPDTVFVPYVPDIVVEVKLEDRLVLVNPPEGLFDLLQPKCAQRVHIRGLLPPAAESLQADPHHIHE